MASTRQLARMSNIETPRAEADILSQFPPQYYHDIDGSEDLEDLMWLEVNHWQEMIVGEYLVSSNLRAEFEQIYDKGDCRRFTELLVRDSNPLKAIEHMVKVAKCDRFKDLYWKMPKDDPGRWRVVTYSRTFNSKTGVCDKTSVHTVTGGVCSGIAPQQAEWDFMNGYSGQVWKDKKGGLHSKRRPEAAHVVDKAPTQKEWNEMTQNAYHMIHNHNKGMSQSECSRALSKEVQADFERQYGIYEDLSVRVRDRYKSTWSYIPQEHRSLLPDSEQSQHRVTLPQPPPQGGEYSEGFSSSSKLGQNRSKKHALNSHGKR